MTKKNKDTGITLIILIITVVIMLILAGVAISAVVDGDGLFSKINYAKVRTLSEQIKESISIYELTKELENVKEELEKYPLVKNSENQYLTLDTELSLVEKENLPEKLKYILLNLSIDETNTNVPTLDMIDYTKFYKLDTSDMNIPNEWKDNLYLCLDKSELGYKVINIKGIEYNNQIMYVLIPFNEEDKCQYFIVGNNTYKLYGDGTLKVLGELNNNSGITQEESSYINGWNKLDLLEINSKFGNRMSLDSNGNAKKIYISYKTIYVIDQNNDLWAWGDNSNNKLGLNHSSLLSEPTKIYSNVKNVWAGAQNSYLVTIDNKIMGAGTNTYGALGQGNTDIYNTYVEIKIDGITGADIEEIYPSIVSFVSSTIIKCNENAGGTVFGVGRNSSGQLGLGNTIDCTTFTQLDGEFNNIPTDKIAFNGLTTFIIKENGELYGCGQNLSAQLGISDMKNRTSFVYITSNVEEVRNNSANYSVIKNNLGEIYMAGGVNGIYNKNFEKISNFESDVNARILGNNMIVSKGKSYYINTTSKKVSSLFNKYNIVDYVYFPLNYVVVTEDGIYTDLENITAPGCKANYSLRKVMDNVVYVTGRSGLLNVVDRNENVYGNSFVKNTELSNIKKILVSSADNTIYALTNDGQLYAKGDGSVGLWGDILVRNEFQHITSNGTDYIDNIKDIFVTTDTSGMCYITEDGKLYWAGNRWNVLLPNISGDLDNGGQLNNTTAYAKEVNSTVLDKISKDIIDIARSKNDSYVSTMATFLLTNEGKLYVMSTNSNTSGLGKVVNKDFEELVIKKNVKVKQIVTYDFLSMAVLENGEVYGWGYNVYGIMGSGYALNAVYPNPQKLAINNVDLVTLGDGFAIFKTKTGEIYGVGKNDYGQLGTGDTIYKTEFVRCPMLEE